MNSSTAVGLRSGDTWLPPRKLYVLVRADLTPGQQLAQSSHAALRLALALDRETREWRDGGEVIVILSVPDEMTLVRYQRQARTSGVPCRSFREPDMDHAHTAVAFLPQPEECDMFKDLSLALRPKGRRGRRWRRWQRNFQGS